MKIDKVPFNDPEVWKLYHEGRTKGIFQLESNLGRSWAKKSKPNNIEELAALVSILRPGCLKAISEGKSMSQHYVDRKNGLEPVSYLHDSLIDILKPTYGVLIYQEQCMRIAQKLAGFSETEADALRKAIGKKKADLMAKVRKDFVIGCEKVGTVDAETADEIFGWIEKSARYSFNKSHAVSYAINSYWSAYRKFYQNKEFFVAYLEYSGDKQDPHQEVYELVSEAKLFDLSVKTPRIVDFRKSFYNEGDIIYFGIKNIKSLTGKNGDKTIETIEEIKEQLGDMRKVSWLEILIYLSENINSTCFKTLASIGFFLGIKDKFSRNKCLYDYEIFSTMTKKEIEWVKENYPKKKWATLLDCFIDLAPTKKEGGGTFNENRKQVILNEIMMLKNPPYILEDDVSWIIDQEVKYLGCPVSMSKIEASDATGNTTCKEILDGKQGKGLRIAANIARINNFTIKKEGKNKGKDMSFLTIEDETAALDSVVIFPDSREEAKYDLFEGNNVMVCGSCEKGDGSFVVEKIYGI